LAQSISQRKSRFSLEPSVGFECGGLGISPPTTQKARGKYNSITQGRVKALATRSKLVPHFPTSPPHAKP